MHSPIILGLCTANRCRSQMFEAILQHLAGDRFEVLSAGTKATQVHPLSVKVLSERGINAQGLFSKQIEKIDTQSDLLTLVGSNGNKKQVLLSSIIEVITLCGSAKESCPAFPVKVKTDHWPIDDPDQYKGSEAEILPHFRVARDDIWARCENWLKLQSNQK